MAQLLNLPDNLPIPLDDGKCNHLTNITLPNITLNSTGDNKINLSKLKGFTVLYFYPRTGRPDVELLDGWNEIPGARGCTPQSCSFRDNHQTLTELNVSIYGISTQSTAYQKELVQRLHLPYEILSDENLELTQELNLPTFQIENMTLTKRVTLICKDDKVVKCFYPVFPPDENIYDVINWIRININ